MKCRNLLVAILIVGMLWHAAVAQPKKKRIQADGPAPESILANFGTQPRAISPDLVEFTPQLPLGPGDVLKSYEIAMSLVAEKTSSAYSVIVQAEQANQISREQAEYLLQQQYETAMMQYQVLSALHEVLEHDIEKATLQLKRSQQTASSDEVAVVPLPITPSRSR